MPSTEHELPLEMVRNRPQLAPAILRTVFGMDLPETDEVTLTSESFAGLNPAELRCDATVLLDTPDQSKHGIVVESQLRGSDKKAFSWPAYLSLLRLRHKCPVTLLVLCPTAAVARACAVPIDMGHPGWVFEPLTVHPGMLPPITDTDEARRLPELAVLSAPAHVDGPHAKAVMAGVCAAIDAISGDNGQLYHDYLVAKFSAAAREILEETVTKAGYQWQSDFAKSHIAKGHEKGLEEGREKGLEEGRAEGRVEGRVEGRAEGEAKVLLLVLEARGIAVPNDVRERVASCTDTDQLERWVKRAAVIDKAEDLLG